MNRLNQEQQELILDFYFRCGEDEDIERGRDLIASNAEAARLYSGLEETLTDLDEIKYEPCPDNLVDLTVARLKIAATARSAAGAERMSELLNETAQSVPALNSKKNDPLTGFSKPNILLHNIFRIAMTAVAVFLIVGTLFPTLGHMRAQSEYRTACMNNMRQIGQGFASFMNDNGDRLAKASVTAGSPWWKIGDQSEQSKSNTRCVWQLVKGDYVPAEAFTCAGHKKAVPLTYDAKAMSAVNDFPSRQNISYSFMLLCEKTHNNITKSRRIILSDRNPVFSSIPCYPSLYQTQDEFESVIVNEMLKQQNSPNHNYKGQNALYCDGSVEYLTTRTINGDDIFTLNNVTTYKGNELPTAADDVFLVP